MFFAKLRRISSPILTLNKQPEAVFVHIILDPCLRPKEMSERGKIRSTKHFRYLKWRYPHTSCMDTAYPSLPKSSKYIVRRCLDPLKGLLRRCWGVQARTQKVFGRVGLCQWNPTPKIATHKVRDSPIFSVPEIFGFGWLPSANIAACNITMFNKKYIFKWSIFQLS